MCFLSDNNNIILIILQPVTLACHRRFFIRCVIIIIINRSHNRRLTKMDNDQLARHSVPQTVSIVRIQETKLQQIREQL